MHIPCFPPWGFNCAFLIFLHRLIGSCYVVNASNDIEQECRQENFGFDSHIFGWFILQGPDSSFWTASRTSPLVRPVTRLAAWLICLVGALGPGLGRGSKSVLSQWRIQDGLVRWVNLGKVNPGWSWQANPNGFGPCLDKRRQKSERGWKELGGAFHT